MEPDGLQIFIDDLGIVAAAPTTNTRSQSGLRSGCPICNIQEFIYRLTLHA